MTPPASQEAKATSPSPCDVLALQKCLEQNKGDRKKCAQEVQAFQQACSKAPNNGVGFRWGISHSRWHATSGNNP
ncbi:hypothetical protein WJX82_009202 [Trebouxia sp. C0006]